MKKISQFIAKQQHFIVFSTLTALAIIFIVGGCNCDQPQKPTVPTFEAKDNIAIKYNIENQPGGYIPITIVKAEYENHQYIIFYSYRRMAASHDPNCLCNENTQ